MRGLGPVVALVFALGAGACTTPTLPLPPPVAPSITQGTEPDTFHLSSVQGAQPNALIIVINRNPTLPRTARVSGTIADERGSWDLDVTARAGDYLDVSQESDTVRSPPITVMVR